LIERAQDAGYRALIVTVDSLVAGNRERDRRNHFAHHVRYTPRVVLDGLMHPGWLASVWLRGGVPRFENIVEFVGPGASAADLANYIRKMRNPDFSWDDLAWIRARWRGPLLLKGVLSPEDARRAFDAGAEGIVVSNHGGRQLDGAIATLDALPPIVDAVGDSMTVLIDGGFRRGADVVKALALGAKAVVFGRAPLYGVAAAGEAGVDRALGILREETHRVLTLLGCPNLQALSRECLREIQAPVLHG
jgi:(S)-mandelate dehydrogenase